MKNLIPFIIIALFVFLVGKCTHGVYVGFRDFPEYASAEVMAAKYQNVIDDMDSQIEAGSSVLSIGANLESLIYPPNTVYVAMVASDDEHIIIKGNERGSYRITIKDGFGYGELDGMEVVVISYPINKAGLEKVLVYIKYLNSNN